jgi:hypothetical protein
LNILGEVHKLLERCKLPILTHEETENPKSLISLKNCIHAKHWWLMPIILAIQEAEIRRIAVQSRPRETVHEILSQKYLAQKKKGLVEWLNI